MMMFLWATNNERMNEKVKNNFINIIKFDICSGAFAIDCPAHYFAEKIDSQQRI